MILIPQRLFEDKHVKTILRDGNMAILTKELDQPIVNREGYISNHVISILLAGEQHIRTYDDELIKVYPNQMLFAPRGLYYVSDLVPKSEKFKSLLFYFDDDVIHSFLANSKVTSIGEKEVPGHLKLGAVPMMNVFAESLLHIYQHQAVNDKQLLRLKILELLHLINTLVPEQQLADFLFRLTLPKKRRIRDLMEKNYDKPLKVEDYAYLSGRSISSFRRDFKTFYDTTPQQCLKDRRMEKALDLIAKQDLSVSSLAYEVGYENTSYFIKEFKKKTGQSPKQYILSHRRDHLSN